MVTLEYNGLAAIFPTRSDFVDLTEYPQIRLANQITPTPASNYRPWQGFGTLLLDR